MLFKGMSFYMTGKMHLASVISCYGRVPLGLMELGAHTCTHTHREIHTEARHLSHCLAVSPSSDGSADSSWKVDTNKH